MPHVLLAGPIHDDGMAVLHEAPGFTLKLVNEISTESYAPFVGDADAILIRTQPLPASVIATAPRLKIVSRHGVGYDAVDEKALTARKIPLAVVGDVNSRAVAEHTLMLILSAARRTVAHDRAIRQSGWNIRNRFETVELDGKTLLLVGFGRIGRRVAELARAFGMHVLGHDPFMGAEAISAHQAEPVARLDDGLPRADYVSLHVPLVAGGPVIGAAQLALMKPGAILINAARGGLVDELALDQALTSGRLGGAGLDVFAQEPPRAENPLLANPLVTLSPHSAGLTAECAARMGVAAARNIVDYFTGKLDPALVVNAAAIGFKEG
jgi:D-3-phosphoglycerate dehydrogenase